MIGPPPYSPELNPCEQFWDLIKDEIGFALKQTLSGKIIRHKKLVGSYQEAMLR
jgi:transposase